MISIGGPPGPIEVLFGAVGAIILVAAWVILASSRFVQGGLVERPERVPQLYGYTALLIALVMGLFSSVSIVENILALKDPLYRAEPNLGWAEPSLTSFEAFRATYDRSLQLRSDPRADPPPPLPDAELQRRFEALRVDRIAGSRVAARHALVTSGFSLLVAIALFITHWRWLRRKTGPLGVAPNAPV